MGLVPLLPQQVGGQSYPGENSHQGRRSASDGPIGPLALGLHAQVRPSLHERVDSGRGQDRTLRGKAPVRHVPPLRYPFIPAGATLSVRGSSSGRRSRSPRPPPNRSQQRLICRFGNNCGSGTLSVHFPHDGNAHRIRALFHRPAGSGGPAPGAPGAGRRRGSHLHRSRPRRHHPRRPGPRPGPLRPGDPMGKLFFNILATFAEFETDLIRRRPREGMAIARARGKLRGKQPKLSDRPQRELCRRHATGEYSISDLAELCSVSRPTVYRTLNRPHSP